MPELFKPWQTVMQKSLKKIEDLLESQTQASEERAELRRALPIAIANLLSSLDEERPTILRKLNAIEIMVDLLLERGNGNQSQP